MPDAAFARDLAICTAHLRAGSKSFALAGRLLPRRVREPATVLYAFCRVADDAVDDDPDASDKTIDALRRRLDRVYAQRPDEHPIDRALAHVVAEKGVPRDLLDALLEGFAWDANGRSYETLDDLVAYAARVAGTVGAMMSLLMGARETHLVARACDLGVAMQLTNVARDVGEDARRGRLYLPRTWVREAGLDPAEWLRSPRASPAVAELVERLLANAEELYRRADAGIEALPVDCRFAIRTARRVYADIGRYVARARFDSVTRRAVVPTWRKLWLVFNARWSAAPVADALYSEPLGPTRFLVQACERSS